MALAPPNARKDGKIKGIRIVGERRRKRVSWKPPDGERHPWTATGKGRASGPKAFISSKAMMALVEHCEAQAKLGLEAMGFLSGSVFAWNGRTYTVIRDALTATLEATSVHVRFDRSGFPGLFRQLDGLDYEYIIVGWYHSHPGYGCFMSGTDQDTQLGGFKEPFHVALVVDPVRKEMMAFRIPKRSRGGADSDVVVPFEDVAFLVYDEGDWPWPGPARKR